MLLWEKSSYLQAQCLCLALIEFKGYMHMYCTVCAEWPTWPLDYKKRSYLAVFRCVYFVVLLSLIFHKSLFYYSLTDSYINMFSFSVLCHQRLFIFRSTAVSTSTWLRSWHLVKHNKNSLIKSKSRANFIRRSLNAVVVYTRTSYGFSKPTEIIRITWQDNSNDSLSSKSYLKKTKN